MLDQVMKVVDKIVEGLVREKVHISDMQFGFTPGCGTTDAMLLARQMQEKYLSKKKKLYFAFIDLEKAFDKVPREVMWWAMQKLGVEEWLVWLVVKSMYKNARSRVTINGTFSEEIEVKVGVHQGSVLSPLLFIMVLEALSHELKSGYPKELLYAGDPVLIAESMEEFNEQFQRCKEGIKTKGLE